ncbi:MarR family winged helix-turn-helix transcriptional regulator [Pseudomonas chlororaphis]|uniref:MarR family winged helix-turn-helix transcriptional regulator n=1 Tax=Pseudomonas chlororaphis TaxID=587753 RepID=UPI000472F8A8|nr:MarR family winged helix-turn-helix transcriptional regulator [Pseudomonas chlororaphis]AVO58871.1 MarR family transcriptional regulator [Pseudomonas chlororaphis subsp. piscium]AZC50421.1 Transcriptional regulator, MarR family [Pseudomonas chlororaphis subsp. piscium]AZC56997.1 Transcriptional regulator, MarR family [Pseudomonas chlororaphis subsp. piscium]AZC63223.1 Transcriptional regulator, MarR family [Pseudomonas chlororaphis subsp. piscium]AZC75631.1 Transcriptional regulator, MarR f
MHEPEPTPAGAALTDFILSMFRASNLTLAWGDRIVAPLGLTSARWQILGAIVAAERPQPVAWLARDLEANRQNVQRIVNDLEKEGLVTFQPNPHHRRAQLVTLTDKGTAAFNEAIRLYTPLVNELSAGLEVEDIQTALRVITELRNKLQGQTDTEQ